MFGVNQSSESLTVLFKDLVLNQLEFHRCGSVPLLHFVTTVGQLMACIPHVFFPVEHFLLMLNGVVLLAAIGQDGHDDVMRYVQILPKR